MITQQELASIFPEGVPMPVVKMVFPEKSEPLTVEDIRFILNAMRHEAALSTDAEPVKTPFENDAVWARFYRDGKKLGEICEEFNCSIYDLSPWLTAPLTRSTRTDPVKAAPAVAVKGAEPVAWRYKDFADGWILDHSERSAREYQRKTGCVMQALYTSPPTVAIAIEHLSDAKDVASCRSRIRSALSAQVHEKYRNPSIFHDTEGRN